MKSTPRPLAGILCLLASAAAISPAANPGPAPAALSPEAHRAKYSYRRVQPLLDAPMIDPAIARAPDPSAGLGAGGTYYLAGTTGTRRADGSVNFHVNEGVRLWKSADLKNWDDLGLVAPLSAVRAKVSDLGLVRAAAYEDEFKGVLAPEIHFIRGGVYLTYGLHPCGTGLLKSKTGKPEGPYEDVGLITKEAADASLFADEDGKVYWVFGGGWIARMNDAMTALAEAPRLAQPDDARKELSPGGQILQVGQAGAFLFKKDGTYHLLAAGIHGRLGVPCYDTWVATAKSLAGPWSRRKLAVPHGGQATMFPGPDGKQWFSTFSGVDSRAAVRERAAVVPVDWVESSSGYWSSKGEPWPWKRPQVITEAWGWEDALPLSSLSFRDVSAISGGDGYYYATGLHNYKSLGRNTCLLKGKDLTGKEPWEATPIPGYETVDKLPTFTEGKKPGSFILGGCKVVSAKNAPWIFYGLYQDWGGARLLRSESATMAGPWKVAMEPANAEAAKRPGAYSGMPVEDYEGNLYSWVGSALSPVSKDFTVVEKNRALPCEGNYAPPWDALREGYVQETSDGSALFRGDVPNGRIYLVDGKYLMAGGAGWHGDYRAFGTYDSEVFWAEKIGGPWHPNRSVLPHAGNSGLVLDRDGVWWSIVFANDCALPDMSAMRCIPLDIKWNIRGYDIRPKRGQDTPYVHVRSTAVVDTASAARVKPAYPDVTLPPDIGLKDPFIAVDTEGGKTVYYLTGTKAGSELQGTEGDFRNNDGIYLWRSGDLKEWESVGRIASLGRGNNLGNNNPFDPLSYYFSQPDSLEPTYDRGIIAPEVYRVSGDWWIVYSLSRQKIGILKSSTGKPEGPYKAWGNDVGHKSVTFLADTGWGKENNTDAYLFAYDPSLFIEGGTVYCVFGPGWIAPLTKDRKAFVERPRPLAIEGGLYAGQGGCQIFKKDGKYHLLAANEWGDVIERTADAVQGPYRNAKLAFAQATASVFADGKGQMKAAVATAERTK